jgi:heme exporter protein B
MVAKFWWLIRKDLTLEMRTGSVWPPMCLLGFLVTALLSFQIKLPAEQLRDIAGSFLWLATFFVAMPAMERTFAAEREEGCWHALRLYPLSPTTIYFAKLAGNVLTLLVVHIVLILLFVIFLGFPVSHHLGAILAVAFLGNLCLAAIGTLFSALSLGLRRNIGLVTLVILPVTIPAIIAAAEATRLLAEDQLPVIWWHWIQLLAAFAVIFVASGAVLIDFLVEE